MKKNSKVVRVNEKVKKAVVQLGNNSEKYVKLYASVDEKLDPIDEAFLRIDGNITTN